MNFYDLRKHEFFFGKYLFFMTFHDATVWNDDFSWHLCESSFFMTRKSFFMTFHDYSYSRAPCECSVQIFNNIFFTIDFNFNKRFCLKPKIRLVYRISLVQTFWLVQRSSLIQTLCSDPRTLWQLKTLEYSANSKSRGILILQQEFSFFF